MQCNTTQAQTDTSHIPDLNSADLLFLLNITATCCGRLPHNWINYKSEGRPQAGLQVSHLCWIMTAILFHLFFPYLGRRLCLLNVEFAVSCTELSPMLTITLAPRTSVCAEVNFKCSLDSGWIKDNKTNAYMFSLPPWTFMVTIIIVNMVQIIGASQVSLKIIAHYLLHL